ncbi:MAG: bifunctional 4-hydroxy-2-oxoglutarate aldolase/2-dehydro-3-deoxy-phosphogluconate aldolase [Phaeodactylibacter sp.]|nr:bifunctional 4-hydroxy-2-oxoglutarate aldolase/2-dehydro-3-deoxy-phosphogluconate aldolase [Phaeodactylibacter sp.]
MARFTRIQVAEKMGEQGMVPLFYHADLEVCKKVIAACYRGGARLLEFTNRGDYAQEVFGALNKFCARELPDMILGVGSVTDSGTAALFLQLGGNFIVSASIREDVALVCNRRKVLYSPGCGSLTEIGKAEELGCEIVKLFPGSVYSPNFIQGILGPQPWTSIMPTGGVSPERDNLKRWFDAGAYCVGMGSKLMVKNGAGRFDYEAIEQLSREALGIIRELRGE